MSGLALLASSFGLASVGIALFVIVLAVGLAQFRRSRVLATLERVKALALNGSAQEARVLARASGAWAMPLVHALAGEPPRAPAHAVGLDAVFVVIAATGALQAPLAALTMRPSESLAVDTGALLASMAVVLPLVLLAVTFIVRLGVTARRQVRSACAEILLHQLSVATSRPKKESR